MAKAPGTSDNPMIVKDLAAVEATSSAFKSFTEKFTKEYKVQRDTEKQQAAVAKEQLAAQKEMTKKLVEEQARANQQMRELSGAVKDNDPEAYLKELNKTFGNFSDESKEAKKLMKEHGDKFDASAHFNDIQVKVSEKQLAESQKVRAAKKQEDELSRTVDAERRREAGAGQKLIIKSLNKMGGWMKGMWESTKKTAATGLKGAFIVLGIMALLRFLESDTWKKMSDAIKEWISKDYIGRFYKYLFAPADKEGKGGGLFTRLGAIMDSFTDKEGNFTLDSFIKGVATFFDSLTGVELLIIGLAALVFLPKGMVIAAVIASVKLFRLAILGAWNMIKSMSNRMSATNKEMRAKNKQALAEEKARKAKEKARIAQEKKLKAERLAREKLEAKRLAAERAARNKVTGVNKPGMRAVLGGGAPKPTLGPTAGTGANRGGGGRGGGAAELAERRAHAREQARLQNRMRGSRGGAGSGMQSARPVTPTGSRGSAAQSRAGSGSGMRQARPQIQTPKINKALNKVADSNAAKKAMKVLAKYPKLAWAAKKIPWVGPILMGAQVIGDLSNPKLSKKQKIQSVGGLVGGSLGAAKMGMIGAGLGALFSGPAAIVAGPIGGLIGAMAGWWGGEWAGRKLIGFLMDEEIDPAELEKSQGGQGTGLPNNMPPGRRMNRGLNKIGPLPADQRSGAGSGQVYAQTNKIAASIAAADGSIAGAMEGSPHVIMNHSKGGDVTTVVSKQVENPDVRVRLASRHGYYRR